MQLTWYSTIHYLFPSSYMDNLHICCAYLRLKHLVRLRWLPNCWRMILSFRYQFAGFFFFKYMCTLRFLLVRLGSIVTGKVIILSLYRGKQIAQSAGVIFATMILTQLTFCKNQYFGYHKTELWVFVFFEHFELRTSVKKQLYASCKI